MIDPWLFIFEICSLGSGALLLISQLLLRLTLDKRVRKAMPADKIFDGPLDIYGGWMRSMGFGYAAVFERAKNYAMKDYYDGFDVKTFANTFEKCISYIFVISGFVFIFCITFFIITYYLGFLEWPYE